ncbi:hypothetical protein H9P43_002621 [Blastocladiella emersonii ATCC 22665]|nr:hypothetical protein H9P43_002621 [Blastocladiella emersonii ATCC 22665]
MSKLRTLWLHGNQLEDAIPDDLLKSESITSLMLKNNKLSGTIPDFSTKPSFGVITLNNNKLGGTIPAELGRLVKLVILKLNDNDFSGPLPRLDTLAKLEDFDVSNNNLGEPLQNLPFVSKICKLYGSQNERNSFTCRPDERDTARSACAIEFIGRDLPVCPPSAAGAPASPPAPAAAKEKLFPVSLAVGLGAGVVLLFAFLFAYISRRNQRLADQLKEATRGTSPPTAGGGHASRSADPEKPAEPARPAPTAAPLSLVAVPDYANQATRATSDLGGAGSLNTTARSYLRYSMDTAAMVPSQGSASVVSSSTTAATTGPAMAISRPESMASLPSVRPAYLAASSSSAASTPAMPPVPAAYDDVVLSLSSTVSQDASVPVPAINRESIALMPEETRAYFAAIFTASLSSPPTTPATPAVAAPVYLSPAAVLQLDPPAVPAVPVVAPSEPAASTRPVAESPAVLDPPAALEIPDVEAKTDAPVVEDRATATGSGPTYLPGSRDRFAELLARATKGEAAFLHGPDDAAHHATAAAAAAPSTAPSSEVGTALTGNNHGHENDDVLFLPSTEAIRVMRGRSGERSESSEASASVRGGNGSVVYLPQSPVQQRFGP